MQSTFCVNCKEPLPAGASFCGNCGTRQPAANAPIVGNNEPTQLTPPPAPPLGNNEPTRLTVPPPPSADEAPTSLVPPPPPEETVRAGMPPVHDPYASQYNVTLPVPPPYAPYGAPGSGPAPAAPYQMPPPPFPAPGSGPGGPGSYPTQLGPGSGPNLSGPYPTQQAPFTAPPPAPGYIPPMQVTPPPGGLPQAQTPPKKKRKRSTVGCIAAVVLVVLVLGSGSVLAYRLVSSNKGNSTGNHGQQTGNTPGATSTTAPSPTPTNTPGVGNGAQTLTGLNTQAIYAGVSITILGAQQASTVPGYQPNDPSMDALRIQAKLDNSNDTHDVYLTSYTTVVGSNGTPYSVVNSGTADSFPDPIPAQADITGYWYFSVPQGANISDWKVVIGQANESLVTVPLNATGYDASVWQWVTTTLTTKNTVTYYGGALTGTIPKVTTGLWTPGYQAPKGMRFILVDLVVTNNSAADVSVGDPEFSLLLPDGTRENQNTSYGYFINDDLGGHASKDEGYACFLAPPTKGDFQMIFFNQNNGVQAMIDLGTL